MIIHDARRDLVVLAKNPMPSSAVVGVLKAPDGMPLRHARWEATRAPRRGTVVIVQGRGEFIEKYFEVIADLRRRGYDVAIFDVRGQGGSGRMLANPRKGYVRSFDDYDRDLAQFMREIVLPHCPPPYIALGHSLGGNLLARVAADADCWFERIVLTAPMIAFADEKVGFPQWLARFYVCSATMLGAGRAYVLKSSNHSEEEVVPFERNTLTSCPERYARCRAVFEAAPDLGLGSPTNAWAHAAYRSIRRITHPDYASRVRVPMLVFASGHDQIVSTAAIEAFTDRLKVGAFVLIASSRHEILQERDVIRQQFWATFDAYLGIESVAA